MDIRNCFKIGYIARNHGLKGEVSAIILEDLNGPPKIIFLEDSQGLVPYFVEKFTPNNKRVIIKFEEVNDAQKASLLNGRSLYLPRLERPELPEGEYYHDELVGLKVEDKNLGFLGEVTAVRQAGPNRLLVINHNNQELLIPQTGPFIETINLSKKEIMVSLPQGFLEL